MSYADAQAWIIGITVFGGVTALVYADTKPPRSAWRWGVAFGVVLALGLLIGIETTAKGWWRLPLYIMQRQLVEVWSYPPERVRQPGE